MSINTWLGDPFDLAKYQLGNLATPPQYMVNTVTTNNTMLPQPGGIQNVQLVGNQSLQAHIQQAQQAWMPGQLLGQQQFQPGQQQRMRSPGVVNGLPTVPTVGEMATIYFDGGGWHVMPTAAQMDRAGDSFKPPMAPPDAGITLEQLHEAQDFIEKEIEPEKIHACAA